MKYIFILSTFLFPFFSLATPSLDMGHCFSEYAKLTDSGSRMDAFKFCIHEYRKLQPLSADNPSFNYSGAKSVNEFIKDLQYFSSFQPPGTHFESLKDVKQKALSVVNSEYCSGVKPLGKIWCHRLNQLAQLETEKKSHDFYKTDADYLEKIQEEDKSAYIACVKGVGSVDQRKSNCSEVCRDGHRYKFTCEILEGLNGGDSLNRRISAAVKGCYEDNVGAKCEELCTAAEDVLACTRKTLSVKDIATWTSHFGPSSTVLEYDDVQESGHEYAENDGGQAVQSASIKETSQAERLSTAEERTNQALENPVSAKPRVDTSLRARYRLSLDPPSHQSNWQQGSFQRNAHRGSSIKSQVGSVDVRASGSVGSFQSSSIDSRSSFKDISPSGSLSYGTSLQPVLKKARAVRDSKTPQKRNPIFGSPSPAPLAASPAGGSVPDNGIKRSETSVRRAQRSKGLSYKKYRDQLGSQSFYGANIESASSENDPFSSNKRRAIRRKKARRAASWAQKPQIHGTSLQRAFKEQLGTFPQSDLMPEYIPQGASLFDKQNQVYDHVIDEGTLNKDGY